MKISELKDRQSAKVIDRFSRVVDRIQSTEDRIRQRIHAMEMGHFSESMTPKAIVPEPKEITDLFLAERVLGPTNDILSIEFLEEGLIAKRPVGRIRHRGGSFGTGFLVGQGLVMTAAHVLPTDADAAAAVFEMDAEEQQIGGVRAQSVYHLHPQKFYFVDHDYDVAIVAAEDFSRKLAPLESYGWFVLDGWEEKISPPAPISIIQHPRGQLKKLVVHNSRFIQCGAEAEDDRYCWYTGDTEPGSSGAPVFDPQWNLLALHHRAVPKTNERGELVDAAGEVIRMRASEVESMDDLHDNKDVVFIANQGVRKSRIFKMLENSQMETPAHEEIRKQLLDFWQKPGCQAMARGAAIENLFRKV